MPIASKNIFLRIYSWFSLLSIILLPLRKAVPRLMHVGINGLIDDPALQGQSHHAKVQATIVVWTIVLVIIVLWVRACIILLKTDDMKRVRNILQWFLGLSFVALLGALFPNPEWLTSFVNSLLLIGAAAMLYLLHNPAERRFYELRGLELRRKFFLSKPGIFIMYGIPFGIFQGFTNRGSHGFSLESAIFAGIIFGVPMTIFTRRQQSKFDKTTGLVDPHDQQAMHDTLRTGELPKDPKLLKMLPDYLDKRVKTNRQSKRSALPLLGFIGIAGLVVSIFSKDIVYATLSIFILIIAALNYRMFTKQSEKLADLQRKLVNIK